MRWFKEWRPNAEESASAAEELHAQCLATFGIVEELKALILGAGSKQGQTRRSIQRKPVTRIHNASTTYQQPPKRKEITNREAAEISPERVIPMDENDFRDV